jgi:hypothetical protein
VQIGSDKSRDPYAKFVAEEDLCSELAARERAVYAMKESRADRFASAVQACAGIRARTIGHFEADGKQIALFAVD